MASDGQKETGPVERRPLVGGPPIRRDTNFAQSMIGATAPSGTGLNYGFTPTVGRGIRDLYMGSPPGSAASNPLNLQSLAYGYRRGSLHDNVYQGNLHARLPEDRSVRRRLIDPRQLTPVPEQPVYGNMDEAAAYPVSQPGQFITSTPEIVPEQTENVFDTKDPHVIAETLRRMLNLGDEQQLQSEQIEQGIFALNLNESVSSNNSGQSQSQPGQSQSQPGQSQSQPGQSQSQPDQSQGTYRDHLRMLEHYIRLNSQQFGIMVDLMKEQTKNMQTQLQQAPQIMESVLKNFSKTYQQHGIIKLAGVEPFDPDREGQNRFLYSGKGAYEKTESDVRVFLQKILPTLLQDNYSEPLKIRTLVHYTRGSARDFLAQ